MIRAEPGGDPCRRRQRSWSWLKAEGYWRMCSGAQSLGVAARTAHTPVTPLLVVAQLNKPEKDKSCTAPLTCGT